MENLMYGNVAFWVSISAAIVVILVIFKTAVVVPQQSAFVIESLGKYSRTMRAGFHILILHRTRVDVRLQGIIRIGQGRECISHDR